MRVFHIDRLRTNPCVPDFRFSTLPSYINCSNPILSFATITSFNGIYQIFGHTQQKKKAVIKKTFADLDCRKAFLITPSGKIGHAL